MPRKDLIKHVKRLVVKVGTTTVTDNGKLSSSKINRFARDIARLKEIDYEVVVVSSGAITAGSSVIEYPGKNRTIPEKQALASVGQTLLLNEYRKAFKKLDLNIGQILLTEDDIRNRRRFINAKHTLNELLKLGVIPIINENDSVVVKEIKFGDNDTLAARVSSLIDAELLILLSDIDGFYWDLEDKEPMEEIRRVDDELLERAAPAGSNYGTGGMATKLAAAELILQFGEMMVIANGNIKNVCERIMKGEKIGTIFVSALEPLSSRKKWVAQRKIRGIVTVDEGAAAALVKRKKSLLARGIVAINTEKWFDMGDAVEIHDPGGNALGKGIVNYDCRELSKIIGKKTAEIRHVLEGSFFEEVINRDDLIIYRRED